MRRSGLGVFGSGILGIEGILRSGASRHVGRCGFLATIFLGGGIVHGLLGLNSARTLLFVGSE